jgi:tetratricopeptide (TPR) repeat protein
VATRRIGETREQTLNTAVALALAYQRAGDWRNALEAARRVHRLAFDVLKLPDTHPNAIDARLMLGIALTDAGELGEGVAQLEAGVHHALANNPPSHSTIASYRTHLARALLRAGRTGEAISHLEAAVESQRNALGAKSRRFASTANEFGGALLAARQPERAIAPLREAQAFFAGTNDSLAPIVRARLAVALAATGGVAEAEALAAPLDSNDGEVLWRRGQIARLAERVADARILQQQALAAVPDTPAQQVLRAEVLIERGLTGVERTPADALAAFGQATAILRRAQLVPSPALADAQLGSGRALLKLGRKAEAVARFDEASALWQQLDPTGSATAEAARWRAIALR